MGRASSLKSWSLWIGLVVLILSMAAPSTAVVRDARIEDVPGLRFENVVYNWESLFIDVVNMSNRNVTFGGTMIFLDRYGNSVASVRLLPRKVARNSIRRYTGYFTEGAGDAARRAVRVIWDFGAR